MDNLEKETTFADSLQSIQNIKVLAQNIFDDLGEVIKVKPEESIAVLTTENDINSWTSECLMIMDYVRALENDLKKLEGACCNG